MSSQPCGWTTACLADLGGIVGGKTPSKSVAAYWQQGTIPWVSPKDMKVFALHASEDHIAPAAMANAGMSLLPEGSVLVVTRSGILAHTLPVAVAQVPVTINQDIKAIRPRPDGHDNRYLAYCLRAAERTVLTECSKQGTTVASVESSLLERLPLPFAPRPEQRRIADKLDTTLARVDACRNRLARVLPLIKRFRESVLRWATSGRLTAEWRLGRSLGNAEAELRQRCETRSKTEKKPPAAADLSHWETPTPDGWVVASVHQFAECLDRLRVPIKREARKSALGLYPYYGANGEVGRIDEFIFDDELVLVTEDETFYGREKPIAYRTSGKCWVNNHAHVLRANSKADTDYLCIALKHYNVVPWLSGTTGRAKLTQQALLSLPLLVPPKQELEEIVRRVDTLFAFADRLEVRLASAQTAVERLTPALLAKAFRGELVPQDPADEPAAELLKRLAAQRPADAPRRARRTRPTT